MRTDVLPRPFNRMKIYPGKKLRPKEHIRDWDKEVAEVMRYSEKRGKWEVVVADNFSGWFTEEQIGNDFEELPEDN